MRKLLVILALVLPAAGAAVGQGPTEILSVDDGSPEEFNSGASESNVIDVNRLTPASYPAQLQVIRIYLAPLRTSPPIQQSPTGQRIRLIAFAGELGAPSPPTNPPLLLNQTVTIPAVPSAGGFIDFPIANGPVITRGDFYVGFQKPLQPDAVASFYDRTGPPQQRSFFSRDNGLNYGLTKTGNPLVLPLNLMVRAIVSSATPGVTSVSAASFGRSELAPSSIAALFGADLAADAQADPAAPLPTTLGGSQVLVKDAAGVTRAAPLFFASPAQINYLIPPETAPGTATVSVVRDGATAASGAAQIAAVAPGLFTANATGQGVAAAVALRLRGSSAPAFEPVARFDAARGQFVATAVDLGPETDQVFLILFGTGLRGRSSLAAVMATFGEADPVPAPVFFVGPQGDFVGLDQANLLLPRSLAGRGELEVRLVIDGKPANVVRVSIK